MFETRNVFEHDEGVWDIDLLKLAIRAAPGGSLQAQRHPIDPGLIDYLKNDGGISWEKVRKLPDQVLDDPAIGIRLKNGAVLTVDGRHRILARAERGRPDIIVHIVPWEIAEACRVAPPRFRKS
mgnify:CR=1 FL=1|jgi:hypothetical protein